MDLSITDAAHFHLPTVEVLTTDVPVSLKTTALTLCVKATDTKYTLDRFNVFANDIPIHGSAGVPLPNRRAQAHEQDLQVPLVPGRNKIQISVLNQQGVESLKQTVYTTSTAQAATPDVYVAAIGKRLQRQGLQSSSPAYFRFHRQNVCLLMPTCRQWSTTIFEA